MKYGNKNKLLSHVLKWCETHEEYSEARKLLENEIRKVENEEKSRGYTPIIAFTANTLNNNFQKCLENGMNYLMEKPFNAYKFVEIIESFGQI